MPIIYKITNKLTQKMYIGWTSKSLDERWGQHLGDAAKNKDNRKFYNAIRKYGNDVWTKEILCEVDSNQEAKDREIYYISLYNSYDNGYNSTRGGDGNNGIIMSEESNLARSRKLKGRSKDPKTIEKFKQRKQTEETKEKISAAHMGKKKPWVKWTKEQITKRALTRRSLTKEQYLTIHSLKKSNLTIRKISQVTGISGDLVKKWLKREWEL